MTEEDLLVVFLAIPISMLIYVLPAIVAFCRGHHNRWPIAILNLFLGATGFGWVAALVWALTVVEKPTK